MSNRKVLLHELEVAAPADEVWAVYSSPDLPRLIVELLPGVFESITVVKGDGDVGTVLKLVFPGDSIPKTYREKFVTIDHAKRLKEVLQISEGYLELGASYYMDSFEIIEKGPNKCIIRSKTEYEIDPNRPDNASKYISIDGLIPMANAISAHVVKKRLNGLPRKFALQSVYNGKYMRFVNDDMAVYGLLKFSSEGLVSTFNTFELEPAAVGKGLVHIKCSFNNKYLTRWSPTHWWITAGLDKPQEDQAKWSCTLFEPLPVDGGRVRFRHVQLGHYACLWRVGPPHADCLFGGSKDIDKDQCDLYNIIDMDAL